MPPLFPQETAAAPLVVAIDHTEETKLDDLLLASVGHSITPKPEGNPLLKQLAGAFGNHAADPQPATPAAVAAPAVKVPARATLRPTPALPGVMGKRRIDPPPTVAPAAIPVAAISAVPAPSPRPAAPVQAAAVASSPTKPLRVHETPLTAMKPKSAALPPIVIPNVAVLPDLEVAPPAHDAAPASAPQAVPTPIVVAKPPAAPKPVAKAPEPIETPEPVTPIAVKAKAKRPVAVRKTAPSSASTSVAVTKPIRRAAAAVQVAVAQVSAPAIVDELSRQVDVHRDDLLVLDRQLSDLDGRIDLDRSAVTELEARLAAEIHRAKRLKSVRHAHARFVNRLMAE
jgi:hypothetical protein